MAMNLKEAFRYQNKLQSLMRDAQAILGRDENVLRVESTALRSKVDATAEDETTVEIPGSEYAEQMTDVASFLMYLLNERENLNQAVRKAKQGMEIDFDGEVSMNAKRQEIARLFRYMCELRNSETVLRGGGVGYRFNAEGNQISYRCDLKKVTTINFDRNKIRAYTAGLDKKADRISAELDRCMIGTEVAYEPPFDANDTFAEVLQNYLER